MFVNINNSDRNSHQEVLRDFKDIKDEIPKGFTPRSLGTGKNIQSVLEFIYIKVNDNYKRKGRLSFRFPTNTFLFLLPSRGPTKPLASSSSTILAALP
ncbi:MAG: hypothetical protein DDT23_00451 [candidate division WS2 bacterium]|nr:hypothetical protein [Candidatus Lithacetigena glycinireducens]